MSTHFKRQLWISLSIIFGSILIVVIALYYSAGDITAKADKVAADRALIGQQSDALEVIADLKNQAPQAASYQAAMDQLLPAQDGLISFSQWINAQAGANQVSANVVFQGNVTAPAGGGAGQAGFSIDVSGPLNNISAFLNDVESKTPGFFLQISSFNLVYKNPGYDLTGQGFVFFQP